MDRYLCVVLHDVSPARWVECRRVLQHIGVLAREAQVDLRVTLLVVPLMHGAAAAPPRYLAWLHRMVRAGHEIALHGWTHRDTAPATGEWIDHLRRQWYTAGEGEFAALDRPSADLRLARSIAWAQDHGLHVQGFVAPAWLLSPQSWEAVGAAGFDYTCTLTRIVALPEGHAVPARSVVFSTRSAWRRALSVAWNALLGLRLRQAPLLRLELHPNDAEHAAVLRCWTRLLAHALRVRTPLRLAEAAALARRLP